MVFSVSDNIFLRWLELAHSYGILEKVIIQDFVGRTLTHISQNASSITLLKLFPRELDYRTTSPITMSASGEQMERSAGLETDPWQIIVTSTKVSELDVNRGLSWLNFLSRSGIEVPLDIYRHFVSALDTIGNPLRGTALFLRAMLASLWLRSLGRHRHQRLLANLHLTLVPDLHNALRDVGMRPIAYAF